MKDLLESGGLDAAALLQCPPKAVQRQGFDGSLALEAGPQLDIVKGHELAVTGQPQVELHDVGALLDCQQETLESVLGCLSGSSTMSQDPGWRGKVESSHFESL